MFNIVHDIRCQKDIGYDIGYDIQSLTAFIPRLTTLLPRLPHVCAEESHQPLPWIPAIAVSSVQLLPQQRTHAETFFHTSTSRLVDFEETNSSPTVCP